MRRRNKSNTNYFSKLICSKYGYEKKKKSLEVPAAKKGVRRNRSTFRALGMTLGLVTAKFKCLPSPPPLTPSSSVTVQFPPRGDKE